jgi:DNA-binding response OmpR family regulator
LDLDYRGTRCYLERILLVESDKAVLHRLAEHLLLRGYEVMTASSPDEALALIRAPARPYESPLSVAVIGDSADKAAPFSAADAGRRLRELDPAVAVILLIDENARRGILKGRLQVQDVLMKPAEPEQILRSIQKILNRRFSAR